MIQIEVHYTDHETRYFPVPVDHGWRFDSATRALVIGRGIGRTHVPLDNVRSFSIEKTDAPDETAPEPTDRLAEAREQLNGVNWIRPPELKGPVKWVKTTSGRVVYSELSNLSNGQAIETEPAAESGEPGVTVPTLVVVAGEPQEDGSVLFQREAVESMASAMSQGAGEIARLGDELKAARAGELSQVQEIADLRAELKRLAEMAHEATNAADNQAYILLQERQQIRELRTELAERQAEELAQVRGVQELQATVQAQVTRIRELGRTVQELRTELATVKQQHADQVECSRQLRWSLAGVQDALTNAERELGDVKADREARRRHGDLPFGHTPGCPRIRWSPEAAGGWLYNQNGTCTCNVGRVHDWTQAWEMAIQESAQRAWKRM